MWHYYLRRVIDFRDFSWLYRYCFIIHSAGRQHEHSRSIFASDYIQFKCTLLHTEVLFILIGVLLFMISLFFSFKAGKLKEASIKSQEIGEHREKIIHAKRDDFSYYWRSIVRIIITGNEYGLGKRN